MKKNILIVILNFLIIFGLSAQTIERLVKTEDIKLKVKSVNVMTEGIMVDEKNDDIYWDFKFSNADKKDTRGLYSHQKEIIKREIKNDASAQLNKILRNISICLSRVVRSAKRELRLSIPAAE